jgi:hypothetical protein
MKKQSVFLVLLTCLLALGLSLASCGGGSDVNTDPKTITITGLSGKSGAVTIGVYNTLEKLESILETVAYGYGTIANNQVSLDLTDDSTEVPFTGTGDFYLGLIFGDPEDPETISFYVYTNGKGLGGITTFNINQANSSIAFNKFAEVEINDD